MRHTLHLLNGDGTWGAFRESGVGGETLIFRETFSEGKIHEPIFSELFWTMRKKFIAESYEKFFPENERMDYDESARRELEKLNQVSGFDEVVLWFEFDLFCQINLLFCLNWLNLETTQKTTIKLICPDSHPEIPDFRGLGQLNPEQLKNLLPTAQVLTTEHLHYASEVWQAYLAITPKVLQKFIRMKHPKFPHLAKALEAHLNRFPKSENALGLPHQIILETIREDHPKNIIDTLKGFWKRDKIYGFGDLQILVYLEQISPKHVLFDGKAMQDFESTKFLHFSGKIELNQN